MVDVNGNVLRTVDPLGRVTSATYTSLDLPATITDGEGVTTTYTYDTAGNLLTMATPWTQGSATATTTFTRATTGHPGDVTSITDPANEVWTFTYDSAGNQTAAEDPLGNAALRCYDTLGRVTKSINARGEASGVTCSSTAPAARTTYYEYSAHGDLLEVTDPLGNVTARTYDADRNVATSTDANLNETTYAHDPAGQLVEVERPDLSTVETEYWADGTLKTQIDGSTAATSYVYDAQRRLTSVTDPLSRVTTFGYDAAGNRTTRQDHGGSCTAPKSACATYTYNDAGELTGIDYSDTGTTDVTSITYDDNGRRLGYTDGTGTWTTTWDSLGRKTSTARASGGTTTTVTYGWDIRGLMTSIVYPNSLGTVTRGFDDAGRMTSVTDWLSRTTTFGYDADGNLTSQTNPNGTSTAIDHDANGRVDTIEHAPTSTPTSPFATFSYGRDDRGQITSVASTGVPTDNHTWTYTTLNQLAGDNTATYAYDYDAADNLTQLGDGTVQRFDAANQLCWTAAVGSSDACSSPPTGATTYGYDSRGNRTSKTVSSATTTYSYDAERRLTSHTAASVTTTYGYNADDLRVTKANGGTTTSFVWNDASAVPLLLTEGATAFIYGPGRRLIERISGTTPTHYHLDQLGSVRALSDGTGSVVATYTYDEFGGTTATTGSDANPFQFAGEYRDSESGLTYLRARHYDPTTGQFLSRDPLMPLTREGYAYASQNPLNNTDPLGLLCVGDWCLEDVVDEWNDNAESITTAVSATANGVAVTAAAFPGGQAVSVMALGVSGGAGLIGAGSECADWLFADGNASECITSATIEIATGRVSDFIAPPTVRFGREQIDRGGAATRGLVELGGDGAEAAINRGDSDDC